MSRFELGAVPLGSPTRCLIAGRWPGMRFRPTELRQMEILAGLGGKERLIVSPPDGLKDGVRVAIANPK